ncbi:MAG: hypothetical protein QOJ29_1495 [Thermoleophilaceae bacterium]|jgi:hypothetical protein|nr:hypothetical protein [Thermoleophilaceae bacterium]
MRARPGGGGELLRLARDEATVGERGVKRVERIRAGRISGERPSPHRRARQGGYWTWAEGRTSSSAAFPRDGRALASGCLEQLKPQGMTRRREEWWQLG